LALLVLRRGRVVPAVSAIEVLWPSRLPDDPTGALQNHLSRLRRQLPGGLLASVGEGYRIDPSAIEVDADALTGWLAEGSTIDAPTLASMQTALGRWRGPAYPELDDVDEARTEAVRLEELRTRACEVCAEHRLLSGQVDGVVAEVAALVEAEPLRERPRALLM